MTEVDVIDDEFIVAVDPPNEVFSEFVRLVSTTEGWAFQENDYEIWKNSYPKHWMFMVQQRETDKYVASVSLAKSTLRDGSPLFTVAFFYCVSEFRNRGFGKVLFDKIHTIYGDHNCSLFGVGTMWQWYEKRYGFRHLQPYFHFAAVVSCERLKVPDFIEIDGSVMREKLSRRALRNISRIEESSLCFAEEVSIEDVDFNQVQEYDKIICGMERGKVIGSWLTSSGVHSKMAVDSKGKCVGYGAVREVSLNRLTISPLYADSHYIAALLLRTILKSFNFSTFRTISSIFPAVNSKVPTLLYQFCDGYFETHEFCRSQFTQNVLKVDEHKVFGIRHCAHGYV